MNDSESSSLSSNNKVKCLDIQKDLWNNNPTSFHQSFDDRLQLHNQVKIFNSCNEINQQVYFKIDFVNF